MAVGIVRISEVFASRTRACSSAIRCARAVPIRQLMGGAIEVQLEIRIPIGERRQRVVQEIEPGEPEFYTLTLADTEVLDQRQIAVPVFGQRYVSSMSVTEAIRRCRWRSKAVRVDILAFFETHPRIASQNGPETDIRRSEHLNSRPRSLGSHAIIVPAAGRHRCSGLNRRDSGKLPAIGNAANKVISASQPRK